MNGLGAEEVVRAHGEWPLVSAVTFMSGTKHSDTEVEYILDTATWMGPYEDTPLERRRGDRRPRRAVRPEGRGLPGPAPRAVVEAHLQRDGQRGRGAHRAPARRRTSPTRRSRRDLGHLVHDLVDEGKAVAAAAGIELYEDPWEMNVHATQRGSAHYPSMLEDVEAHRPTEIDLITGSLVREAERHGVAGAAAHGAVPPRQGEGGIVDGPVQHQRSRRRNDEKENRGRSLRRSRR